jgi:hypothetical protein
MIQALWRSIYTTLNPGKHYRSPKEIEDAINYGAILPYFFELKGNLIQYRQNNPKAMINFQETDAAYYALKDFYVRKSGDLPAPSNTLDITNQLDGKNVEDLTYMLVKDAESGRLSQVTILPDNQYQTIIENRVIGKNSIYARYPVGNVYTFNKNISYFEIGYLFTPTLVKIVTDENQTDELGIPELLDGTVDSEWSDSQVPFLLLRTLMHLGININNPQLMQMAAPLINKVEG